MDPQEQLTKPKVGALARGGFQPPSRTPVPRGTGAAATPAVSDVTSIPIAPKRKRGAPPDNTNALKHGLYSRHISIQDDLELESMPFDQSQHELALARVRLKQCIARQQAAPDEDWHKYEKAIERYISIIVNLTNKNALLGRDRRIAFVTVMEMIRQMNERQNVK